MAHASELNVEHQHQTLTFAHPLDIPEGKDWYKCQTSEFNPHLVWQDPGRQPTNAPCSVCHGEGRINTANGRITCASCGGTGAAGKDGKLASEAPTRSKWVKMSPLLTLLSITSLILFVVGFWFAVSLFIKSHHEKLPRSMRSKHIKGSRSQGMEFGGEPGCGLTVGHGLPCVITAVWINGAEVRRRAGFACAPYTGLAAIYGPCIRPRKKKSTRASRAHMNR